MTIFQILLVSSLCFLIPISGYTATNNAQLNSQRTIFQQAQKALKTNQIDRFNSLKQQLDGYPLQVYLDYLYLRHRLNYTDNATIGQFITDNQGTFYADRLRNVWLNQLAGKKQWQTYLSYYQPPQSASRQCSHLQALIATGQQEQAFAETSALWLVPKSQHKACDPVFKLWQDQGYITDTLRWQRIQLALQKNQFNLAKYLAKSLFDPNEANGWITRWQQIHQNPLPLLKQLPGNPPKNQTVSLFHDIDIARDIIQHGIERLARKSTDQAFSAWQRIKPAYQFSEQDKQATQAYIAKRAALRREDRTLEFFGNIANEPWRVRAALWQQDWSAVQQAIMSLDSEQQQTSRWQYWLGRSQAELGDQSAANNTLNALIMERDYYSFLAADKLGLAYQMNHHPIPFEPSELALFSQRPAVARLSEFYALNMSIEARRQAYKLKQTMSARELQLLALLTNSWGWHNQTIALLGKAKYWDALNLRFPIVYDTAILNAAKVNGLDPSWLFAIARQESAFDPKARSHVGATGLMQLMPKTGKLIARLINKPLKNTSELLNPDRNIQLGSAYLHRMYVQNQHNPVLATASYNAGPHRIKRWLPDHDLPTDIWVENIPFNETRRYTRSVLSYAAIFDYQRKQPIKPLSDRMPAVKDKNP